ncbi:hypothetical protein DdX_11818 [Ditylenchus destructor]|uniref:Uncharacterized protein n=1 Tax=Ditylenchus destructor TaxID=166010 RepID=A0AAD4N1S5_9BILA|nr:hypothetical protein DdX_11818 [Ditylenchus destructor]
MEPQGIDPSFVSLVQPKIRLMNQQPAPEVAEIASAHSAASLTGWASLKKQSSKRKRWSEAWNSQVL